MCLEDCDPKEIVLRNSGAFRRTRPVRKRILRIIPKMRDILAWYLAVSRFGLDLRIQPLLTRLSMPTVACLIWRVSLATDYWAAHLDRKKSVILSAHVRLASISSLG